MRPRRFDAGEELCRAGEPSDAIWVITGGLVHWLAPTTEGAGDLLLRLRKGDVIGAQDAITGEPTVGDGRREHRRPTTLEMDGADFVELAQRYPQIPINVIRNQRERVFRAGARAAEAERGEEIALVIGPVARRARGAAGTGGAQRHAAAGQLSSTAGSRSPER